MDPSSNTPGKAAKLTGDGDPGRQDGPGGDGQGPGDASIHQKE